MMRLNIFVYTCVYEMSIHIIITAARVENNILKVKIIMRFYVFDKISNVFGNNDFAKNVCNFLDFDIIIILVVTNNIII